MQFILHLRTGGKRRPVAAIHSGNQTPEPSWVSNTSIRLQDIPQTAGISGLLVLGVVQLPAGISGAQLRRTVSVFDRKPSGAIADRRIGPGTRQEFDS